MAGYSDTPLLKKLGYKEGTHVYLYGSPKWFVKELTLGKVLITPEPYAAWAHAFFNSESEVIEFLMDIDLESIEKALWVSWPKKSSGKQTDLTEQTFRDLILPMGWVDIKVASIDDTWSGLKFTRRNS